MALAAVPTSDNVLRALGVLYHKDSASKARREADEWLNSFQKMNEAWQIVDSLLREYGTNYNTNGQEVALFAAQTLRQKVRYDLAQLDPSSQLALRDSLLFLLLKFKGGPRSVSSQLCMALAGLAILVPTWDQPLQQLSTMLGQPDYVCLLLSWLVALVEEFENDRHSTLSRDELKIRRTELVAKNSSQVLHILLVILNSTVSTDIQHQTLDCLALWLNTGDIPVENLSGTAVIDQAFQALLSEDTFEPAVDVICEITRRCGSRLRRKEDPGLYMPIIQSLYGHFCPLLPALSSCQQGDDDEKLRGFCRIFADAGESFITLILDDVAAWKTIVDGLLICVASADLDIVGITFQFWMMLADVISPGRGTRQDVGAHFVDVYRCLIDIMIRHLHYPADSATWTAKERDEFREFRHNMGDVLKVCVVVLGQEEALSKPFAMLRGFVVNGAPGGALDPSVAWQNIEAPLFAIRTMGREVSNAQSQVLPQIMSMLPQLPSHPKVRYAAILVIGRYASWTRLHPDFIPYQMTFISKGFEDKESVGAASQALRYICDECGERIVDYLSQLHPFYMNIVKMLDIQERTDLTTALAHVVKHVPVVSSDPSQPNMSAALEMFCLPVAQRLHAIGAAGKPANGIDKELRVEIQDLIDQFSTFLSTAQPANVPKSIDHPCLTLFLQMWPVLDSLFVLESEAVATAVCKVIVKSVDAHGTSFRPLIHTILPRLADVYDVCGVPSIMWAGSKMIHMYGSDTNDGGVMHTLVERMSRTTFKRVQENLHRLDDIDDVIEDYFFLLYEFLYTCPKHFLQSPYLQSFVECAIACMSINRINAWFSLYSEFLKSMVETASPNRNQSVSQPMVETLVSLLKGEVGYKFMKALIVGLTSTFPHSEDIRDREREPWTIGSIVVNFCDAVVPMGLSLGSGEGFVMLARSVAEIDDPKWSADERGLFLKELASDVEHREVRKVDRLLMQYAMKYKRRNHDRL